MTEELHAALRGWWRIPVITTANLEDFTPLPDGIEARSPDEFLCNLFDLDPEGFVELLREQASRPAKRPRRSKSCSIEDARASGER